MFRRRRKDASDAAADGDARAGSGTPGASAAGDAAGASATPARAAGPWDSSEVDSADRLDLGALRLAGRPGMELRLEVADEQVVAVTAVVGQSALQLQAFAAPRTEGIWAEVRREIAAGVSGQGGTADEVDGALGPELRAKVPVRLPDGSAGVQPVRFVGCDGPRWFLRGVVTGRAVDDPQEAAALDAIFRDVVVVRGNDPRPPKEPLPLHLPPGAAGAGAAPVPGQPVAPDVPDAPDAPDAPDGEGRDPLRPFERGPEITEIR